MEAKELRLRDWVFLIDIEDYGEVISVSGDETVQTLVGDKTYTRQTIHIDPIPLTEEILLKNGFIKDGYTNLSYDYVHFNNGQDKTGIYINLRGTCDKNKEIYVLNRDTGLDAQLVFDRIKTQNKNLYVHQLQHLLSEVESKKEIEL